MIPSLPKKLLGLLLASLALAGAAHAQDGAPKEGALDKYINRDAKDTATKLDVVIHSVYEQEQRVIVLNFQLEHGDQVRIKRVAFPSKDVLIPGYVFTPVKMVAGKRYPAIVMVHGGFHERFDWRWFQLVAQAIEKGYVVMFPEYRGSRGYGAEHYRNDYGVTDTADVIASGDYMAKQSFVDANRLGVMGQSRGGMTTLLAIAKAPQRFKAAVDIVGLADFVAYMAYKPEYRRVEVANESASFKGQLPNDNLAAYMDVSPVNHVDKMQAPLLVLATTGDKIAPYALHTGRLLDLLKAKGKTFESHTYDNAPGGHVFMDGDTDEQRDATRRVFDFFSRYMK